MALYFQSLRGSGGAERMIVSLSNDLLNSGYDVTLVTLDKAHTVSFYALAPEISWHRLGFSPGVGNKLRRFFAIYRILRQRRIGALIGFVISGDLTALAAGTLAGVRIFAAERNAPSMYSLLYSRTRRWINFLQLHLAHRIVVQFPRYAEGYPPSLRSRIAAISNPVPQPAILARPHIPGPDGRFQLVCVSRLEGRQKQIAILIEAFAHLAERYPDWNLVILGDGPDRAMLQPLVEQKGLMVRIALAGASKDVFPVLAASHLFVLPSAWEGFPNALAEALAHGLPAVGFAQADGVADLLEEAGSWLAPGQKDPLALSAALGAAMVSAQERRTRGMAARGAMKKYDHAAQLRRWLAVLDDPKAGHV